MRTNFTDINLYTSSREPHPIPLHKLFVNLVWEVGDEQYIDYHDYWPECISNRDNEEGDFMWDNSSENKLPYTDDDDDGDDDDDDDDDDETSDSEGSCHTSDEMNVNEANNIPTLTNVKDSNKNILTIATVPESSTDISTVATESEINEDIPITATVQDHNNDVSTTVTVQDPNNDVSATATVQDPNQDTVATVPETNKDCIVSDTESSYDISDVIKDTEAEKISPGLLTFLKEVS